MPNPWLILVLAAAWLCRWPLAAQNGVEPHGWPQAELGAKSCQPKCNSCRYGDCISAGICRCWPGYKWQELPPAGCRPLAQLLLPAEQCLDRCPGQCWRPLQEQQLRCFRICRPGRSTLELELKLQLKAEAEAEAESKSESEFCLQVDGCVCNSLTQSLICQNMDQDRPQEYACLHQNELQQGEVPEIVALKVRRLENTENLNGPRGIQMDEPINRTHRGGEGERPMVYFPNDKEINTGQFQRNPLPGEPIKDRTLIIALLVFCCIIIVIIVIVCIFNAQSQPSALDEV